MAKVPSPEYVRESFTSEVSHAETLMEYLDEVESSATASSTFMAGPIPALSAAPSVEASMVDVFEGVRHKLEVLNREKAAAQREAEEARRELEEERQKAKAHVLKCRAVEKSRREQMKTEYEATIARIQTFSDRLLQDKQALTQQCQELAERLAAADAVTKNKLETQAESHRIELKRLKESWVAGERMRRAEWIKEKESEIKERTIRSLEPEMRRMAAQHTEQIRILHEQHRETLRQTLESKQREHDDQIGRIRARILADIDAAVAQEREAAQRMLREQQERYEAQLHTQRLRMAADVERTVASHDDAHRQEMRKQEDLLAATQREHEQRMAALSASHALALEEASRRHRDEIQALKEGFRAEKLLLEQQMRELVEVRAHERLDELRAQLQQEQDAKLDIVVRRLESEFSEQQRATQSRHDDELHQQQLQHQDELAALHRQLDELRAALRRAGDSQSAAEASVAELRLKLEQQAQATATLRQRLDAAEAEAQKAQSEIDRRQTEITEQRAAVRAARDELAAAKELHRDELQRLHAAHDAELQQLNARVRAAVSKKDEQVAQMREQLRVATLRLQQTEELLQRQGAALLR